MFIVAFAIGLLKFFWNRLCRLHSILVVTICWKINENLQERQLSQTERVSAVMQIH